MDKELKFKISKNTYNKWLIIMFDNAKFHKTDRIVKTVKFLNWIVYTFPPYSPKLNEAEHTFGVIKSKLSKRNFNGKAFVQILKDEQNKI